jgi:hypothetical protein
MRVQIKKMFEGVRRAAVPVLFALLPLHAMAAATINLAYSPATINPGDADTLTISLFNDNTLNGLTAAAVTLSLPSGVTVAAVPATVDTCGFL